MCLYAVVEKRKTQSCADMTTSIDATRLKHVRVHGAPTFNPGDLEHRVQVTFIASHAC